MMHHVRQRLLGNAEQGDRAAVVQSRQVVGQVERKADARLGQLGDQHLAGFQFKPSAMGHGIPGVDDEVEDRHIEQC